MNSETSGAVNGSLGLDLEDNTVLIYDSSVKTGNCVLTIHCDGRCSLHKHKAGHLLYALDAHQESHSNLQFLECTNCSKTEAGQLCAFSDKPFDKLIAGETTDVDVVLMQGMAYCCKEHKLKFVFYRWKFSSKSMTVREVIEGNSIDGILDQLFETNETVADAHTSYLMYFNQFAGAKHAHFEGKINKVKYHENRCFYESSLQPDNWGRRRFFDNNLANKYKWVRLKEAEVPVVDGVHFVSSETRDKNVVMGRSRKLAQRTGEIVRVLYCKHVFDGSSIDDLYLLPLPTSLDTECRLLAPITKAQAKLLDDYCIEHEEMSTDAFIETINLFMTKNNQRIIKVSNMEVSSGGGKCNKFIVSIVKAAPTLNGLKHQHKKMKTGSEIEVFASDGNKNPYIWTQQFEKNIYEYEVPFGVVILQCFASIFNSIPNQIFLSLLVFYALSGDGLKRSRTDHQGKFFIIGQRHSCQSNKSMSGYQQNHHQYSDKRSIDQSYLPHVMSLINALSDLAGRIHASSGAIMKSTAEKVRQKVDRIIGNTSLYHWVIITHHFCNTRHFDSNDYIHSSYFDRIWEYVNMCNSEIIVNYFSRYKDVFPDFVQKKQWPLSTTCCWVPTGVNKEWVHLQYFVLIDYLLAFDLSSAMFNDKTQQLASTFYGSTFSHLTSKSLWISTDGSSVSTVPMKKKRYGLFAWGEYSGKSKQ